MSDDPRFEPRDACPACGGASFRPRRRRTFDPAGLDPSQIKITDRRYGAVWDLSRCDACGHLFADPAPTPAFIDGLYARVEDPLYDAEAEGRRRNFERILDVLEERLPGKGRLLDVGAATGILMDAARARGWRVDGVEPSRWAIAFARERYGLEIVRGTVEEADLPAGAYDAVTCVDVIEHTARPEATLRRVAGLLREGGLAVIVTPDGRSVAARLAGRRWWHYRPGHLSYFTKRSLDALVRRCGLETAVRRRYAWVFSANYLVSRLPVVSGILRSARIASFLRGIPIKLALRDSFEIYARKAPTA